jgi:hypothetical protein
MRRHQSLLIAVLLALTVILAAGHPISPVQALRDKKALSPTADSHVTREFPDANWGRTPGLFVRDDEVHETLAFLMFDLAELPSNAAIEEATLRLYPDAGTSNGTVNLHHCPSNDWNEYEITYNNKPAYSPEPLGNINVTSKWTWYELDLTQTARSMLSKDNKRLSLALTGETLPNWTTVAFNSRNFPLDPPGQSTKPQLSVLYSYTPSSGIDPVVIGLIAVGLVSVSGIGLGLIYMRRKRRKQSPAETQPTTETSGPSSQTYYSPNSLADLG